MIHPLAPHESHGDGMLWVGGLAGRDWKRGSETVCGPGREDFAKAFEEGRGDYAQLAVGENRRLAPFTDGPMDLRPRAALGHEARVAGGQRNIDPDVRPVIEWEIASPSVVSAQRSAAHWIYSLTRERRRAPARQRKDATTDDAEQKVPTTPDADSEGSTADDTAEAARKPIYEASPSFTLRQFANVPPRVYREAPTPTPSRPRARSVPHVRGGTPNPPSPFRCSPWALSPGRWGEDAPAPPSPPVPAAAPAARALRFSPAPRGGALATPAGSVQTPVRSRQIVDWGSSTKEAKENVAPRGNTLPMAEAGRNLQSLFDAERGSEDIAGGDPEHCAAICPAEFERAAEEVERRRGQRPATEAGALGGAEWGGTPARRDDDILGSAVAIPPGFRLVPDEERRETLGELRQRMRELDERYARLPLKIET
ncbi:unnamed protein product, partial [Prorocentrum cordatum]